MMSTRRETPFTRNVKGIIRAIPRGRVATYGQVAALAGRPGAARGVAWILHSSSDAAALPWHRVINRRGGISLGRGRGFEVQKRRLAGEGVAVSRGGRVDLKRFQWEPNNGAAGRSHAARKFLQGLTKRPIGKSTRLAAWLPVPRTPKSKVSDSSDAAPGKWSRAKSIVP